MTCADISAKNIDYINLHGTGTRLNDSMESDVIHRMFGGTVPVSTTKPVMGHTLGAAGAIEAAILWLLLKQKGPRELPPQVNYGNFDATLPPLNFIDPTENKKIQINRALSTSFAFGGHNTALILERVGC